MPPTDVLMHQTSAASHRFAAPLGLAEGRRDAESQSGRGTVLAALSQALAPARVGRATLESLAEAAQLREVLPGRFVMERDRSCAAAWLLIEGQVCVGRHLDQGGSQLVRTVGAGQWIDAASCWLDLPARHDTWVPSTARSAAWLAEIPRSAVHTAIAQSEEIARAWLGVLAQQVRRWSEATDDLMHQGAEGRCARWLLSQGQAQAEAGGPAAVVELHERKRVIAAQLGITPETFSRVLRELTRKALIQVEGYHVRLLDPAALAALAAD